MAYLSRGTTVWRTFPGGTTVWRTFPGGTTVWRTCPRGTTVWRTCPGGTTVRRTCPRGPPFGVLVPGRPPPLYTPVFRNSYTPPPSGKTTPPYIHLYFEIHIHPPFREHHPPLYTPVFRNSYTPPFHLKIHILVPGGPPLGVLVPGGPPLGVLVPGDHRLAYLSRGTTVWRTCPGKTTPPFKIHIPPPSSENSYTGYSYS